MIVTEKNKGFSSRRFWGRMNDVHMKVRIVTLVFIVALIISMSFCQLGFWPMTVIDGKPVYLLLILAPLIMGAFLYGPYTGTFLGLLTGAVLFIHATALPLDFYEIYFMTPLNTFGLLTVLGGLSGLFFSLVFHHTKPGAVRIALIAAGGIVLSFAASALMMVNTVGIYSDAEQLEIFQMYLFNSPRGVVVQALADAALIVVLVLASDAIVRKVKERGAERALLSVFRNWMILVSCTVFMLASAIIFSFATIGAQKSAFESMGSEARYLVTQLDSSDTKNYGKLLEGYTAELDGSVAILDKQGVVVATDDEQRFPKNESFINLIGYNIDGAAERSIEEFFGSEVNQNGTFVIQAMDQDGNSSMDFMFGAVDDFDQGYVVILKDSAMVYTGRFNTMMSSTVLALVLIVSISILATILLNQVVVRRIGETNDSLEKITEGNLNERVDIHDSREFISLSTGINTTVAALRDTIDEVRQRNEQELMTAKAIQESSLPTDFPAFPEIDTFDIYASMKTAKAVGGDFYDFFLIEDTPKMGFIMADVSGKGVPAALFMMTAKTQIRNYMESGISLGEAIDAANHQLCLSNEAGMFVTAWVGELNYETGELTYVCAGHNPPMMLHDGSWDWVRDVSGMPLGIYEDFPYSAFTCQLQPGDMLYTYTDGVTEAMDVDGNMFGEDRLEATLKKYAEFNPRSVCVGMRRAITDFTLDCEQSDDITMLGLKYGVPPETRAVMILQAKDDQLVHVCNYIHAELHRRHAPKAVYNPLDIAAEELFINVCHYAFPEATPENPGEVRISFEYEANPPSLTVQIMDNGIPYNPLAKPDAVTPDDIMEVPIGGLGILMAKNSVDEMYYEREDGFNVLTFKKKW